MSKLARDNRNADLARIHMAKAQLGLDDATYRTVLMTQCGVSSARDLDHAGRQRMLRYLQAQGAAPAKRRPFGQPEKIEWLWKKLGEAQRIRDASPQALLAFIARITGTGYSHARFLPVADATKVIEALKAMLNRPKADARP